MNIQIALKEALYFIQQGKLKEAEIAYEYAIKLKPDHIPALMNRGKLYFDKKEYEKALIDSDKVNSKEARAFSLEILYSLGRIKEIYNRIEKIHYWESKFGYS